MPHRGSGSVHRCSRGILGRVTLGHLGQSMHDVVQHLHASGSGFFPLSSMPCGGDGAIGIWVVVGAVCELEHPALVRSGDYCTEPYSFHLHVRSRTMSRDRTREPNPLSISPLLDLRRPTFLLVSVYGLRLRMPPAEARSGQ